ncbi:MAG: hypothetical protein KDD70_16550 [Bdellovibrionales bacterium]|nr:hypothetical protein [Bdellovibrionales bacterium]
MKKVLKRSGNEQGASLVTVSITLATIVVFVVGGITAAGSANIQNLYSTTYIDRQLTRSEADTSMSAHGEFGRHLNVGNGRVEYKGSAPGDTIDDMKNSIRATIPGASDGVQWCIGHIAASVPDACDSVSPTPAFWTLDTFGSCPAVSAGSQIPCNNNLTTLLPTLGATTCGSEIFYCAFAANPLNPVTGEDHSDWQYKIIRTKVSPLVQLSY